MDLRAPKKLQILHICHPFVKVPLEDLLFCVAVKFSQYVHSDLSSLCTRSSN